MMLPDASSVQQHFSCSGSAETATQTAFEVLIFSILLLNYGPLSIFTFWSIHTLPKKTPALSQYLTQKRRSTEPPKSSAQLTKVEFQFANSSIVMKVLCCDFKTSLSRCHGSQLTDKWGLAPLFCALKWSGELGRGLVLCFWGEGASILLFVLKLWMFVQRKNWNFQIRRKKLVWHFVGFFFQGETDGDTFSSGLTILMHLFFCQYLKYICNTFTVWTWNQTCFCVFKCVLHLFIRLLKQFRSSSSRLGSDIGWSWELMRLNWIFESQIKSSFYFLCYINFSHISELLILLLISCIFIFLTWCP